MFAIKKVRLIDGTENEPRKGITILIENGIIREIGNEIAIPESASVINAEGLTAIPGLIDMHTHLGSSASFDYSPLAGRLETFDYALARESFLKWGVTTVRTCGEHVESILSFREEANSGKILSPRVIACGPFFQIMNGHPWGTVYEKDPVIAEKAMVFVDQEEPIEEQVDQIAALGVDFIKAFYPADNSKVDPNAAPRMTIDQLKRIIDRAHKNGLKCACHIDGPEGMAAAAAAGADTIEHAVNIGSSDTFLTDEMINTIKTSKALVDPTMIATHRMSSLLQKDAGEALIHAVDTVVKKLYENDIPLAVGCDSGIPFVPAGESLHDELQCLVNIGVQKQDAIRMASLGNASILGLADRIGSIEVGKEADLILLGSDPLEKIENTKDIRMVLMKGKIVRDELLV